MIRNVEETDLLAGVTNLGGDARAAGCAVCVHSGEVYHR